MAASASRIADTLRQRAGGDHLLGLVVDRLVATLAANSASRTDARSADEEAQRSLLARIVDDTAERLTKARRTFLHTDRPELFALREVVRELGGSGSALGQVWEQLARAGYMHIRDGRRRFSTPHGLLAHPTSDEIALAFAASGVRALEAERHFETLCASLGRHQPPIWDDRFGTDGCRGAIAGLTLPGWHWAGTDAEYAVTASVLAPTQPNVFHALSALYATGASVDRYADEDGPGFLVLRLAPVDAN
jgi:hypothetical protein